MAEELTTLREGSDLSAAADPAVGFGAGATSDATATSDAGSIAFERIASVAASASSFLIKSMPLTSTALTGPVRPRSKRHLALGWAHASAKVRRLMTTSA